MDIRCKNCSSQRDFRNQRGNKISDLTCTCGGKFERMICKNTIGISPLGEDYTFRYTSKNKEIEYFYLYISKNGEFVLNRNEHKFYPYE